MNDVKEELVARVVIPGLPMVLSYAIPDKLNHLSSGSEVTVELGKRKAQGWITETIPLEQALKEVIIDPKNQLGLFASEKKSDFFKYIKDGSEAFLPKQLRLFKWMSDYYGATLCEVIDNAIPKRTKLPLTKIISLTNKILEVDDKKELLSNLNKKAPNQSKLIQYLLENNHSAKLKDINLALQVSTSSTISALIKKGLIERSEIIPTLEERRNSKNTGTFAYERPEKLNSDQVSAIEKINTEVNNKNFCPFLLFGVTGSGKTEVYLQAIENVLTKGGSALVIIPEISLSPQYIDRFTSRLNCSLAVLHSQVGASARWAAWEALRKGEVKVALGARSAIFAPMPDLQLIIVDEEHESSYKQSDSLRYNARDVAVMRGKFSNCPVILGSATPSFESLLNAQNKKYKVLRLPERASPRPLPSIEVVDMGAIKKSEKPSENISPQLYAALSETLKAKKQAVILYNRRGFASYLQCETCQDVVECPSCSVPLTFHKKKDKILCHWCGYSSNPPEYCPKCKDPKLTRYEQDDPTAKQLREKESFGKLSHRGSGTERVVDEIQNLFPEARIARMDRDTVGHKDAYREILSKMKNGEADVLIGTQMIAKGHDLPGVTLVGIIDADVGLHVPDFRSSERAYQLITQAGGRAGRGDDAGKVFIQTREPQHPTIVAAVTGRFKAFARYEIEYRKTLNYPPVGRLLRLIISSTDKFEAMDAAKSVRKAIKVFEKDVNILGPATCSYERIRGRFRMHILIKAGSPKIISQIASSMRLWKQELKGFKDFRLGIDVDPIDML